MSRSMPWWWYYRPRSFSRHFRSLFFAKFRHTLLPATFGVPATMLLAAFGDAGSRRAERGMPVNGTLLPSLLLRLELPPPHQAKEFGEDQNIKKRCHDDVVIGIGTMVKSMRSESAPMNIIIPMPPIPGIVSMRMKPHSTTACSIIILLWFI